MMFKHDRIVFLVDDDPALLEAGAEALELADMPVRAFSDAAGLLAAIDARFSGVVVTDIRMPTIDGMELLKRLRGIDAQIPVILMTGHGDMALAIEALRQGASDFLPKPFSTEHLMAAVTKAIDARHLVLDDRVLRTVAAAECEPSPLIGSDPAIVHLRARIQRIAPAPVDVLIEGETGTGKELAALMIHRSSPRRNRPFVPINCGALSEAHLDLELFGQGASDLRHSAPQRTGRIEAAEGGTLFLDEVDAMPPAMQVRLLRVIEEREVHPIGSPRARAVDFRLVAAAKSNLVTAMAEGTFRADLYHRLATVQLHLPPLRARRGDIPMLFASCVEAARQKLRSPPLRMTDAIRRKLMDHDWPGNVRELNNFAIQSLLDLDDTSDAVPGPIVTLPDRIERWEVELIREALRETGGRIKEACDQLGIPRKTLYDKIARYGIDLAEMRSVP